MKYGFKQWTLLAVMLVSALIAHALKPTQMLANQRGKVDLEQLLPSQFGGWTELKQSSGQIVNPQQTELLKKLYTQTLSRTYVNSAGTVVMLSIAYGANQSDGVALHYPEVCYPAQGFQLEDLRPATLVTDHGTIASKQLMTRLGKRSEPVTYWSTLGDQVVLGGLNTKLAQLKYGFDGVIPDGLIFRVSTIDIDMALGHANQAVFVKDLMSALPAPTRLRLAGLSQ
jgi:EpsI family protein